MTIPPDVKEFLEGYPSKQDDPTASDNLYFYSNSLRCKPDGLLIEEIHDQWFRDYYELEYNHGFIQWLFPIQERGMNFQSQRLQRHEIAAMKSDPIIIRRILRSYKMMLDFYGMRLVSEESGLVDRSLPPQDNISRYRNLSRSPHNYLRISRILKCLSEFGLEHLNIGFLLHVLCEQSESKILLGLRNSMDKWWANCVRNKEDREWIGSIITSVRQGSDEYVFTREMYKNAVGTRLTAECC